MGKHGGNGQPGSRGRCDGQGLMSYGSCKPSCRDSQMPDRWSECSVADFERTFRSSTHRCLAMGQGDTPHPEAGCTCNGYIHRGRGQFLLILLQELHWVSTPVDVRSL